MGVLPGAGREEEGVNLLGCRAEREWGGVGRLGMSGLGRVSGGVVEWWFLGVGNQFLDCWWEDSGGRGWGFVIGDVELENLVRRGSSARVEGG